MKIANSLLIVALLATGALVAAQPSSASYGTASQYTGQTSPGPTDPNGPPNL